MMTASYIDPPGHGDVDYAGSPDLDWAGQQSSPSTGTDITDAGDGVCWSPVSG